MRGLVYKNSFKKEFALVEKRGKDTKKLAAVIALLQQDFDLQKRQRRLRR